MASDVVHPPPPPPLAAPHHQGERGNSLAAVIQVEALHHAEREVVLKAQALAGVVLNLLTDNKISDLTKLNAFENENLGIVKMIRFVFEGLENIF